MTVGWILWARTWARQAHALAHAHARAYQVLAQSDGVTLPNEALSVVRHLARGLGVVTRSSILAPRVIAKQWHGSVRSYPRHLVITPAGSLPLALPVARAGRLHRAGERPRPLREGVGDIDRYRWVMQVGR